MTKIISFFIFLFLIMSTITGCDLGSAIDVLAPRDPLLHAASKGDVEKIRYLVKKEGRDINYKDASGETALHHAARWCKADAIPVIIELGGETDARARNNDAPLHLAASKIFCESTIANLLNAGAAINSIGSHSETALHKAVKWSVLENVNLLKQRGALTNKRDERGKTPRESAQEMLEYTQESLAKDRVDYQNCLKEKALNPDRSCSDNSESLQERIKSYEEIMRALQ